MGNIISVKPSAMQYVKITVAGEIPRAEQTGIIIGIISIIFDEAEPINICKNKIKKYIKITHKNLFLPLK